MALILSLQGCMAVGKTTAVRSLQETSPYIHVSPEDNAAVIEEIRRRGLRKDVYADYLEIQRLFLMNEVRRHARVQAYPCAIMDFGAEEIEFYTLNYPRAMGLCWEVEAPLKAELDAVRRCMPARILYLCASEETLRQRKAGDASRSRTFFEIHLTRLMPLKERWFAERGNVDVLRVDNLSRQEMCARVKAWADGCIARTDSAPKSD